MEYYNGRTGPPPNPYNIPNNTPTSLYPYNSPSLSLIHHPNNNIISTCLSLFPQSIHYPLSLFHKHTHTIIDISLHKRSIILCARCYSCVGIGSRVGLSTKERGDKHTHHPPLAPRASPKYISMQHPSISPPSASHHDFYLVVVLSFDKQQYTT